jgi:hypothetical protein
VVPDETTIEPASAFKLKWPVGGGGENMWLVMDTEDSMGTGEASSRVATRWFVLSE